MKEKLYRFMQGRYGSDSLNRALLVLALVFMFLSLLKMPFFNLLAVALIVLAYYRMFSRNIPKRVKENQWYYYKTLKLRKFFEGKKKQWKERKIYRIYKCPDCKQKIRVPRGRGKIEIRCARCGNRFIRNS